MPLTMNDSTSPVAPAPAAPVSGQKQESKFPALPDGAIVSAEVVRCTIKNAPPWEDYLEEVSFGFRVIDEEYRNRWLWGGVEARLEDDPSCTLAQWLKSIMGINSLPADFEFIEEEFAPAVRPGESTLPIGDPIFLRAKVQVSRYYSKKHEEYRNKVVAVLPISSGHNSAEEAFGA